MTVDGSGRSKRDPFAELDPEPEHEAHWPAHVLPPDDYDGGEVAPENAAPFDGGDPGAVAESDAMTPDEPTGVTPESAG